MGLYCDPRKGLNIFESTSDHAIKGANEIVRSGKVCLQAVKDTNELEVQVELRYWSGGRIRKATVRIFGRHDHISEVQRDDQVVYKGAADDCTEETEETPATILEFLDVLKTLGPQHRNDLLRGIRMNCEIAEEGLRGDYGLRLGKRLSELLAAGRLGNCLVTRVRISAAAAGDARMGGVRMPVMTTAGSGNQGITALIPLAVVAREHNSSDERLSEAALLAHLVTKYVCDHSGYLSAMCGCSIKAGIGAAAGVAYLLGGDARQINHAINIVAANITGMICDGAKDGCALKLATAAGLAVESALLAIKGMVVPSDNGIVFDGAEETIRSVAAISQAMAPIDMSLVEIMQSKSRRETSSLAEEVGGGEMWTISAGPRGQGARGRPASENAFAVRTTSQEITPRA